MSFIHCASSSPNLSVTVFPSGKIRRASSPSTYRLKSHSPFSSNWISPLNSIGLGVNTSTTLPVCTWSLWTSRYTYSCLLPGIFCLLATLICATGESPLERVAGVTVTPWASPKMLTSAPVSAAKVSWKLLSQQGTNTVSPRSLIVTPSDSCEFSLSTSPLSVRPDADESPLSQLSVSTSTFRFAPFPYTLSVYTVLRFNVGRVVLNLCHPPLAVIIISTSWPLDVCSGR